MADYSDFATAVRAVQNKGCPPGALMQIAAAQPNLRPMIAAHPNADAPLLDWLEAQGDIYVQAAVKARRASDAGRPLDQPAQPKAPAKGLIAIIVAIAVLAAAAGVAVGHWAWRGGGTSGGSNNLGMTGPLAAPQVAPPDGNSSDPAQAAWITVPNTPKPNALVVDVHFDYQCPYCGILEKAYDTAFQQLVESGDIQLRLHTRTFLDRASTNRSSSLAAMAAACVDVADNTKYLAYHNTIFTNQPQEGTGYTNQQLRSDFATAAGLTGDALTTFQACFDRRATYDWTTMVEPNNSGLVVNQNPPHKYLFGGDTPLYYDSSGQLTSDTSTGTASGVSGTPMIFVNGNMMNWGTLFDSNWNPTVAATGAGLLPILQQAAGS